MELPRYQKSNSQERIGINAVALSIAKMGHIWRETPMADVGIDGQIEYVNPKGFTTGRIVAVQVKSGPSYFHEKQSDWVFYPEEKHRLYWERFPLPVLIIIHNPETHLSYWQDVRQSLRSSNADDPKGILIPKRNVLQQTSDFDLFEGFGVLDQEFMSIEDVFRHLINTETGNNGFPVSYFNLFSAGLTNICRSLYFNMDIAMTIAEEKVSMGEKELAEISLGEPEQEFLFEYVKYLVHQHIADVDFSDCMIDWYERKMMPIFVAPLTSRGRKLVDLIHEKESDYIKNGDITDCQGLSVAQESLVRILFSQYELQRISLVEQFVEVFKRHSDDSE